MKKFLTEAGLIFLLAFSLRFSVFLAAAQESKRSFQNDSPSYLEPALNLVRHGTLSGDPEKPLEPSAKRTPGYPLFLAGIFLLAGPRIPAVLLLQAVLGSLTCVLVYTASRGSLGGKGAGWGGVLLALSVVSISFSSRIAAETLFVFLFLIHALFFLRLISPAVRGKPLCVALSSFFLGLAVLTKPIVLYFFFLECLFVVVLFLRRRERFLGVLLAGAGLFLLPLAPWLYRNYRHFHVWGFSSISSEYLLFYCAPFLEAKQKGENFYSVRDRYYEYYRGEFLRDKEAARENPLERAKVYKTVALKKIGEHPFSFLFYFLQADFLSLLPASGSLLEILGLSEGGRGTLGILHQEGLWSAGKRYFGEKPLLLFLTLPDILHLLLTYSMFLWGVYSILRRKRSAGFFFCLLAIFYFFSLPGPCAVPRFRTYFDPFLCLISGYGITKVRRRHGG